MRSAKPQIEKGRVEDVLDETVSDEEMDFLLAGDHDEINALLQEAYCAKERGESAPLEPLHVLLAEERARLKAARG